MAKSFIPKDLKNVLEELAEAVVPIGNWMKGTHKDFEPDSNEPTLPWRQPSSPTLSTRELNVVGYLESYWTSLESDEAALIQQLQDVQSNPPADLFPKSWRKKRRLNPVGVFGVAESENTPLMSVDEVTHERRFVGRAAIYRECWEPLRTAIELYGPNDPPSQNYWESFAKWMHRGEFGPRLSEFIHLFAVDVLRALMNQDRKAHADLNYPQQAAFLIELGEGRRYGIEADLPSGPLSGKHTEDDVKTAVKKLTDTIPKVL